MIIKNKDVLSENPLRERALDIIEAGLEAVQTENVLKKAVKLHGDFLFIKDKTYDLKKYRKIYTVAFGKAAWASSFFLENLLGDRLNEGIALSLKRGEFKKIKNFQCTHPDPSYNNVEATKKAIELIKKANEDDLIIVSISGGGSAILTAPYKITFEEKAMIARQLMNSGADINELNIVRRHLSNIKGGRLAELAYPAALVSLVFSDVIGNDISTIASGPTAMDHTSVEDAKQVLNKYQILEKVDMPNLELNESPKDSKYFEKVENVLVMDNLTATASMEEKARSLGYSTRIFSNNLHGDSHKVGKMILAEGRKGEALIAAGETTVEVYGSGVGGRNQELVLSTLPLIKEKQVLVSVGTDGHDHSNYAGAVGDKLTLKKVKEAKIDPEKYLKNNDSFHFFEKVGDGVETGLLESNVADIMLVLTDK